MSDSGCLGQSVPSKPYHNSKFFEHMNGEVPGYGQDAEIMQRLYGSSCYTPSSTSSSPRNCSGISEEPVKDDELRNTSSSEESTSSDQRATAHSTVRLVSGRRTISKLKKRLDGKVGRRHTSSSESFQTNAPAPSNSQTTRMP